MSGTTVSHAPDRTGQRFPDSGLLGMSVGTVVTLAMLIVGLLYTGAAAATAIDDPGALVRWGLPVTNIVFNISAALTIGALVLAAVVVPRHVSDAAGAGSALHPGWQRLMGLAGGASIVWTLAAIGMLLLGYIDTAGRQALEAGNFSGQLSVYVTTVASGTYWLIGLIVAAIVSAAVFGVRSHGGIGLLAVFAMFGLLPQALTGHAASAGNHDLAISSIGLHIVGVAIWFGGLIALALLASSLGPRIGIIVERYSSVAIFAYCLVAVSGIFTTYVQVGSWAGMTSKYGALIIVKAIALILLGFIGWWHREFIIARLKRHPDRKMPGILSGSRRAGSWTASAAPGGTASAALGEPHAASNRPGGKASARSLFWRFVAGELILLGLASGAAVALSRSPKPAPQPDPVTPSAARQLTGYPLPPKPDALHWLAEWRLDLLWAVVAAAALVAYWLGVYAVRRSGRPWPIKRAVFWTVGIAVLVVATSGPPAVYGMVLFSTHMADQLLITLVAAVLLTLAAPVTLLTSSAPARDDDSRGGREWALAFLESRPLRVLANPVAAAVLLAGSIVVFYFSPLLHVAVVNHVGHEAMVAYFLLVGCLFAHAVLGHDAVAPAGRRQRLAAAAGFAVFIVAFGVFLTTSQVLLDGEWFGNTGRPWGPDAITGQQHGGLVAVVLGLAASLALITAAGRAEFRRADPVETGGAANRVKPWRPHSRI